MNWSEPVAWLDMTDLELCLRMWHGHQNYCCLNFLFRPISIKTSIVMSLNTNNNKTHLFNLNKKFDIRNPIPNNSFVYAV